MVLGKYRYLYLGFNLAASTIATAIAARVPVLVGENAGPRDDLAPTVRAWMTRAQPYPFRAWPIGLYDVLAPILAGNPLLDAIEVVPVLDPRRFVFACGELLFEPGRVAALRARQDAYARRVAELPRGAERFRAVLGG